MFLRKRWTRKTAARIATLGLAVGMTTMIRPLDAQAQQSLSLEGRGGIAVPTGDLADLLDVGPSFGAGLSYQLSPRVSLRLDGDVDILSGVDADGSGPEAPDANIYHYNLGLELKLLDSEASPWHLAANVGAGASTLDFDDFAVLGTPVDFNETYFTANGGLKVAYNVARNVDVFVGAQAFLMFTDEADTAVFSLLRSDLDPAGFDNAWTIPITAGLRIGI
ncbi:MAG: outer membrane beta-barrel protein [Gemmatimonadota bacterium]